MVDFDNEVTISTDRTKIITVLILQRWNYVHECLEKYFRLKYSKAQPPVHIVKSAIMTLFLMLRQNIIYVDSALSEELRVFPKLKSLFAEGSFDSFLEAFALLDDWLCNANLTLFIYRKTYDSSSESEEDEAHGL